MNTKLPTDAIGRAELLAELLGVKLPKRLDNNIDFLRNVVTPALAEATAANTAASSPGPTRTVGERRGRRARILAKRACSPTSLTVMVERRR